MPALFPQTGVFEESHFDLGLEEKASLRVASTFSPSPVFLLLAQSKVAGMGCC